MGSETLWSVARKVNQQHSLGSTAQVAWALFRANPQAFDRGPGGLKPGSTLKIPEPEFVRAVTADQAYAFVTGKEVPAVLRPAPPAATAVTAALAPEIKGVELLPAVAAEKRQWLAVVGSHFGPNATLELKDLTHEHAFPGRVPAKMGGERLEYQVSFGKQSAQWQVVVRNADGTRSAPYSFTAGANAVIVLAAPVVPEAVPVTVAAAPVPEQAVEAKAFARSTDEGKAATMLRAGQKPGDVYLYLAALEESYAGDVDYDYALGSNALDAGRYDDAVFVLQRAVATKPKFSGARMELARAYYAVGDNESARREFSTLQGEAPPPEAALAIAQYLDAIDQRAAAYRRQLSTFAEVGAGYDSNANGGPDTQTFLGFALDPRNQSTGSSYYGVTLGGSGSYPLAPGWRVLGDALGIYRENPDASFVDSTTGRFDAGVEWSPAQFVLSALPSYTYVVLDGDPNHTVAAVDLTGAYTASLGTYSANLRYGQTRFNDENLNIQDTDSQLYGVAGQWALPGLPVQLGTALTGGKDDPKQELSQFGRKLTGGRAFAIASLGSSHTVLLSASLLSSKYDREFFGSERKDDQLSAGLGYQWSGWKPRGWSLGAQLAWIKNKSTVALYDYDRINAGLTVRREFK